MDKLKGRVIGARFESYLNKEKQLLEIELDNPEKNLLRLLNKHVLVKEI